MNNKFKINSINIKGFKSIDSEGQYIPIRDINILLGANGVGKSNLISFFEMLKAITHGKFQNYVKSNGGAEVLLHFGAKKTKSINAEIVFESNIIKTKYSIELSTKPDDSLFFAKEELNWSDDNKNVENSISNNALNESYLSLDFFNSPKNAANSFTYLKNFKTYQFQDTSKESKIRNSVYIQDYKVLHSDGGNLAAFLYVMKNNHESEKYYQRIVKYIRMAMPQFHDFDLSPSAFNENNIILNWYEKDSDYLFGPHQVSDGSLRFMALASLLLQPPQSIPPLIVLDEPELGLHPSAISLLAAMVKTASQNCQVILATQSTTLINEFEAENIIIVERDGEKSNFNKLNIKDLENWLHRYSLSEIWEKNIIGGRP
jgi:predicted ATPase